MSKIIKKHIKKISDSLVFKNKKTVTELLKYLYENMEQKKTVKEIDIAQNIFNRKDFISTDDTIVRVNIHRLRQLLKNYYLEEGKNDELVINIPKGSYRLNYEIKNIDNTIEKTEKKDRVLFILLITLPVLLLSNIVLFFVSTTTFDYTDNHHPVWKDFDNQKHTSIVLGTPYFQKVIDKKNNAHLFVRSHLINSDGDAQNDSTLKKLFSQDNYTFTEMGFSFFSQGSVYGLPLILNELNLNDYKLNISAINDFNKKDLNKKNTIYVGSIKALGFFNYLLSPV